MQQHSAESNDAINSRHKNKTKCFKDILHNERISQRSGSVDLLCNGRIRRLDQVPGADWHNFCPLKSKNRIETVCLAAI